MRYVAVCAIAAFTLLQGASKYDSLPPDRKIELIKAEQIPGGTSVRFGEPELNAYLRAEAKKEVPEGLRNLNVRIQNGRATGHAIVDFVKMRHATGQDLGWIMRTLLEGEHPITVVGRLYSAKGRARVDLERVEIGGNVIKGRALELLISTFVRPLYPEVKVGEQFELGYNMDRIELQPGAAFVVMATPQQVAER